jgi:heme-degrading monooxygenase HmoA
MYARFVTFTGAKNVDAGVSFIRESLLPAISDLKGYRGLYVSADRAGGVFGVLSLWDTAAERDASWERLAGGRREGQDIIGGQLSAETYEQLVVDTSDPPPAAGSPLMVTPVSMDPAKVEENVADFRSNVLPRIKATPGFRAVRLLMNRETGQGMVGTAWADEDAMRVADAGARARRQEATASGIQFGEVSYREILLTDLR